LRFRSTKAPILVAIVAFGLLLPLSVSITSATEPSLEDILNNLGFTNIAELTVDIFPAGRYEVILYAEFAGYHETNELSFYPVNTSSFSILFSGPEGNSGYITPPINKIFSSSGVFGISMYVNAEDHRYYTETWRNPDCQNHSKTYVNLDDPNMYIIGFENLYGLGDRDYNDMVFSLRQFTSTLNITVTSGGTTNPTLGAYVHPTLANVTVTAIPNTHYTFDHWEFDGVLAGSGNPYTAFLTNPYHELLAVFELRNYTLTIVASSGGTTNPTAGIYTHAAGTNVSVSASTDTNYFFDHWILDWLDAGSANPIYVLMYDDHVLEPVFIYVPPTYYLTVETDPEGVATIPGEGWYNESENVHLTAPELVNGTSGIRYLFVRWFIDGNPQVLGANPITVSMDVNHTTTAHYLTQCYLTVTSPYGSPTPQSGWFDSGIVITSSVASPASGPMDIRHICTGWTGTGSVPASGSTAEVIFTINEPSSVTWSWKTQYYLRVETDPPGLIAISGSGWHNEDANVFLSAPPAEGYVFLNWTIDGISQGSGVTSISVNMNEPHKAVAHYRLKIVVGGITVLIKSPLLNAWIGFNSLLIAITIVTASWVKRRRSKNR